MGKRHHHFPIATKVFKDPDDKNGGKTNAFLWFAKIYPINGRLVCLFLSKVDTDPAVSNLPDSFGCNVIVTLKKGLKYLKLISIKYTSII